MCRVVPPFALQGKRCKSAFCPVDVCEQFGLDDDPNMKQLSAAARDTRVITCQAGFKPWSVKSMANSIISFQDIDLDSKRDEHCLLGDSYSVRCSQCEWAPADEWDAVTASYVLTTDRRCRAMQCYPLTIKYMDANASTSLRPAQRPWSAGESALRVYRAGDAVEVGDKIEVLKNIHGMRDGLVPMVTEDDTYDVLYCHTFVKYTYKHTLTLWARAGLWASSGPQGQ